MTGRIQNNNRQAPQFRESINGNRFFYLDLNMNYTLRAWQSRSPYALIRLAQKIAHITLIPFLIIATFEVVVKNGLFLLINLGVALANTIHARIYGPQTNGNQFLEGGEEDSLEVPQRRGLPENQPPLPPQN